MSCLRQVTQQYLDYLKTQTGSSKGLMKTRRILKRMRNKKIRKTPLELSPELNHKDHEIW